MLGRLASMDVFSVMTRFELRSLSIRLFFNSEEPHMSFICLRPPPLGDRLALDALR